MMFSLLKKLLAGLTTALALGNPAIAAQDARSWIAEAKGRPAQWQQFGTLELPSGSIFIGDPSWGDDTHMRGAQPVPTAALEIWLLVDTAEDNVHALWLEATGTLPERQSSSLEFGIDSAYFAFGDIEVGRYLARLRELDSPEAPDSFEFFLPHIQKEGFKALQLQVPDQKLPVFAINTFNDGSLRAVWLAGSDQTFSGILIDITGRDPDGRYIDLLLD